jgi:hypothetical protein
MNAAMALSAHGLSPMASFRLPTLAWSSAADDERRFQRIAAAWCCWWLLLGLVLPLVPLRTPERPEIQPLPAPMARLLLDEKPLPLQPPPLRPSETPAEVAKATPEPSAKSPHPR